MTPLSARTNNRAGSATPLPHRNAAEAWLRKYLNTLSDWQTYLTPDGADLENRAQSVTDAFFGPKVLKGAAWLFGTHLCQQATASAAAIVARDWLRGEELGTHHGITIRKLQIAGRKPRQPTPQTGALRHELGTFAHFSGLSRRIQGARNSLSRRVHLQDSYTFTEGGRAWLCYSLRFPSPPGEPNRLLSALSLLSFPNRSYYFDRLLPFNQAVEITRGHVSPDTVSGFIGDTAELDLLLPLVRLGKLGLYALNWYLIDPAERDAGPAPDDAAEYDNLVPPDGSGTGSGSIGRPYTTQPQRGRRAGAPFSSNFGDWGSVTPPPPPPPPDYFGATPDLGIPIQASFLPGQNTASTNLGPAPVNVSIEMETRTGGRETVWVTVEENAYLVLDRYNKPTGLSVAPAVTLDDKGNFISHTNRWHVIHAETGKLLNATPLPTLHNVRQLADQLAGALDWNRPFDRLTPQEREQAQTILSRIS